MRHKALRTLVLAGALLALSLPAVSVTHNASACSNPGCTTTTTITGSLDTFVSPITVTASTATFAERATTSQVMSVTVPGTLSFTVFDKRGNNQGWVAYVSTDGLSSSLFPEIEIDGSAFTISGTPTVRLVNHGPYAAGPGVGLASSVGSSLITCDAQTSPSETCIDGTPVAAECPVESIGEGEYAVNVPLALNLSGIAAEKFGSYPASWFGSFFVSVIEGQDVNSFAAYGCPPFGPPTVP